MNIGSGMTMELLGVENSKPNVAIRVNLRSPAWWLFAWKITRNCAPWYVRLEAIARLAVKG